LGPSRHFEGGSLLSPCTLRIELLNLHTAPQGCALELLGRTPPNVGCQGLLVVQGLEAPGQL
jgi:hypothetical protein